jgi:hypothetical protein
MQDLVVGLYGLYILGSLGLAVARYLSAKSAILTGGVTAQDVSGWARER